MVWMQISEGRPFDLLDPVIDDPEFAIHDIAVALSRDNRYTGRTHWPISVAQHSVLASRYARQFPLELLLHDAHEAYIGDIAKPIKDYLRHHNCDLLEQLADSLDAEIGRAFGIDLLNEEVRQEIRDMDRFLYLWEKRDAMEGCERPWGMEGEIELPEEFLVPWPEAFAKDAFLRRFYELVGGSRAFDTNSAEPVGV